MQLSEVLFSTWVNPQVHELGANVEEFLQRLEGPSHIHLYGQERDRCRVVVTLLHGNEPSGVKAIFESLQRQISPVVDVHIFIMNVKAALLAPGFCFRNVPGWRDLNRCFNDDLDDEPGRLARALLRAIRLLAPESVIDIHNTSGDGPAFAVTTHMDSRHDALVALFTSRVIVTDLRLGALMEISDVICPTVTIECGGAKSSAALQVAKQGLYLYFTCVDVLDDPPAKALDFYFNPMRLELKDKVAGRLHYQNSPASDGALTLSPDIERFNFNVVTPSDRLGFLAPDLFRELTALTAKGHEMLHHFFTAKDGMLRVKTPLKLFMITSNADIARSDCLFYFVEVDERG